jgi:hypothetical protein
MAWSTPLTAVSNAALTAAQWNASVRDNLLETAPAKATGAGQLFVSTAANAIAARTPSGTIILTAVTTASTSYTDLATVGPAVTVTTGTQAIVIVSGQLSNATAGQSALMSFDVSGASTVAASDNRALRVVSATASASLEASRVNILNLTPGSNVFTCRYRANASGTASFDTRNILVIPL